MTKNDDDDDYSYDDACAGDVLEIVFVGVAVGGAASESQLQQRLQPRRHDLTTINNITQPWTRSKIVNSYYY